MKKKLNCVLLIDDDDVTNFLNRRVIECAEVAEHIEVKLNGKEALDYLSRIYETEKTPSADPLLILLDINMPIMDGWEFLTAYHKEKTHQNVNIVMLSTSNNPDDQKRAETFSSIRDFKSKPLTLEVIEDIVKTYYGHYR